MVRRRAAVALAHPELEERIDAYLEARHWSWQQLERGDCKAGGVTITLDELQVYLIDADPVLWAECNLLDKDAGGEAPWQFFDYQKVGARCLSDCLFECAAEVGKTRDIVAVSLWLLFGKGPRPRGSILIAGALDGNLEDIYDEQDWQIASNPHLRAQIDWDRSKVKPYRKLVAINGNKIDYRPAGNEGKAFRGVHADLAGFFDEAAKAHTKKIWGEFWRALKPWAFAKIYSVPDGVTESEYFRFCRRARSIDPLRPVAAASLPGVAVLTPEAQADALATRHREFVKFRWPKSLMPPPFWTEERRKGYVEQFGGADSSEYQQNVLGNWGDPASTLFPWDRFAPCLKHLLEYRELRLLWNRAEGTLLVSAYRLNPAYEASARAGDETDEELGAAQPLLELFEDELELGMLDLGALLRRVFEPLSGHLVGGIDCGSNDDPTEIFLYERRGRLRRTVARVQLRRFDYPVQRSVVRHVDEIFEPTLGWGLDATGVGTALEHELLAGEEGWSLEGRLSGYVANANVAELNPETGEPLLDDRTGKPILVSSKEYGTRLLERAIQRVELLLPPTPDVTAQWPQYKARKTASGARKFDHTNDHTIDAARVALLRDHDLEHNEIAAAPIVFRTSRNLAREWALPD